MSRRSIDGRRRSVHCQQVMMPPADTACQTRKPGPDVRTETMAAIMRRLLTETVHMGVQLAGYLHCLVQWHGFITQYRMIHCFADSFKSDNKEDEALPHNPPWCPAVHGAPYRCYSHRRLAAGDCPKWWTEDQARSREKSHVLLRLAPDLVLAIGPGIRAFWRTD